MPRTGRPKGSASGPRKGPFCDGTTSKGKPCQHPKGYKTSHPGRGRCAYHGGKKGAPPGNKNAVATGEYETIYASALSEGEAHLYGVVEATRPLPQIEMDLKLACVRIHRMQLRIRGLQEKEATSDDGMELVSATYEAGFDKGKTSNTKREYGSILTSIMRIEEAVSRTQLVKARYIDQLRGALKENPGKSGGLEAIVGVIDRSAAKIAAAKEATAHHEDDQ